MMQNKMKELDLKEKSSKSLLANVLDMDDDYRPNSTMSGHNNSGLPHHPSHASQQKNGGFIRLSYLMVYFNRLFLTMSFGFQINKHIASQ